jgi:hypothetical protein
MLGFVDGEDALSLSALLLARLGALLFARLGALLLARRGALLIESRVRYFGRDAFTAASTSISGGTTRCGRAAARCA